MLNPQWLQSFATLAHLGSFTRTGDELGLTQAAVSQHIRHLETQLGPLLIRRPRQIELTPAGKALLAYCEEVEQAGRCLKLRLSQGDAERGEISLISPGSIGLTLYPLLLDLQRAYPGLTIHHRFAPDCEVREAVLENRSELGVVSLRPDDERLTASKLTEEPLELIFPAGDPGHEWHDLERLGFVDHPDGQAMATRLLSRRYPGNPGVGSLPCRGFINQIGMILEPVARGLGFTILPRYARQAFARQEDIRVVECGNLVVDTLWLIHRAEWPLSSRAQRAVEHLRWHLPGASG